MNDSSSGGCLTIIFVLLILVAGIVALSGWANDKMASYERARGNAESSILRAQGQAALNRAEAFETRTQATVARIEANSVAFQERMIVSSIAFQERVTGYQAMLNSTIPVLVLAVTSIMGFSIVALVAYLAKHRPQAAQPQIIERQIMYLPPPDASRMDVWRQISNDIPYYQISEGEQVETRGRK